MKRKKSRNLKAVCGILAAAALQGAVVCAGEACLPGETLILEAIEVVDLPEEMQAQEAMEAVNPPAEMRTLEAIEAVNLPEETSIPEIMEVVNLPAEECNLHLYEGDREPEIVREQPDFVTPGLTAASAGEGKEADAEDVRIHLDIDTTHIYEHMNLPYSQGYIPKAENGIVHLVVPFLASGPLQKDCLSVELDLGENAPFVYANYRKEVKRAAFQFEESVDAYVFCCDIALEKDRKNGKYPVTVRAVGYSVSGRRAELSSRIFVTVSDGSENSSTGPDTEKPPEQTGTPGTDTENPPGQTDTPGTDTENPPGQTDTPGQGAENPPGQTDAPGQGAENPPGQTDTPETDTENPSGQTDASGSGEENPSGQTDPAQPGTENPSGQTEIPAPGTEGPPLITPEDPNQPAGGKPGAEEPATEEPETEMPGTEESMTEEPATEEPAAEEPLPGDFGGGYSGGSYAGGADSGGGAERIRRQPKFLLVSDSLAGEQLMAGQEYEFTAMFQNMTGDEPVYNMKVMLQSESESVAFGCSSFYFGKVRPQETVFLPTLLTIRTNAQAGLAAVTFAFEYENEQGTAYTAAETVELEICQPSQVVLDGFRLPSQVYSTDTVDCSFAVHNTGKSAVYNVKVEFSGQGLFATESVFAGNLEAGASYEGNMRIYVGNKAMESLSNTGAPEESGRVEKKGSPDSGSTDTDSVNTDDPVTGNSGQENSTEGTANADSMNADGGMYGRTTGILTLTYEDAYGEVYTQTQEYAAEILEPKIVKLSVETPEEQTNQWQAAVLVLTVVVFLLILAFMGWQLRRSRNALADLAAARRREHT